MSSPVSTYGKHSDSIPAAAGIGLRGPYHQAFLDDSPDVAWLEVHSENYMAPDSVAAGALTRIRERYPISLHGVGLSIGSTDPLNVSHLERLRQLADRIQPGLISEHLSWSSIDGEYLHDLLPLPYTEEALAHFVARVDAVQTALGRTIPSRMSRAICSSRTRQSVSRTSSLSWPIEVAAPYCSTSTTYM